MELEKKHWDYADSKTLRCGTMICIACKTAITGEFRYYETKEAYHCQHRSCSESDSEWTIIDQQEADRVRLLSEKLEAYKSFKAVWSEDALDEEIWSLERALKADFRG